MKKLKRLQFLMRAFLIIYTIIFIGMVWSTTLTNRITYHINEGWSLEAATHISKVELYLALPDQEYEDYMAD